MMNASASKPSRKKPKGRTFQCSGYPDCNMTFTRSEHLARHIRKHTGERPFECVQCARKFSRLDNLRQHKQTVHAHDSSDSNGMMKPLPRSPLNGSFPRPLSQDYPQNHQHHQPQYQYQHPHYAHHHPPPPPPPQGHHPHQLQMKQEYAQHLMTKPLPPPPAEEIVQQQGHSLPAATTLVRPSQFRSKHRPRPLDLPASRKSVYNDAPFTVPTPRSAGSSYFALSPVTVSHQNGPSHPHPPPASALPGVQFLTANGNGSKHDSLVSPYNSTFGSAIPSAGNTPTASQFDSLTTPTNSSFSNGTDYRSSMHSDHLRDSTGYSIGGNRRSWLNNVLNNNYDSGTSPASSISIPSPNNNFLAQNKENENNDKKLRIESLLNSGSGNESGEKVKLPHVDKLGI